MQSTELVAQALVEFADTLVDEFDLNDFLTRVTERSASVLGVDAAGLILIEPNGTLRELSASRQDVLHLERFQAEVQEGPCFDCCRTGVVVSVHDLDSAATRWPRFAEAMRLTGYVAVHAVPMRVRDQIIGALNLFHEAEGALDPIAAQVSQALADVASIGLLQHKSIHDSQLLVGQLTTALSSRVVIEQAKGVLAQRYGLDMDEAFRALRAHARSHNLRLTDLCTSVVGGTFIPRPT